MYVLIVVVLGTLGGFDLNRRRMDSEILRSCRGILSQRRAGIV
jgi:hypothetical protein